MSSFEAMRAHERGDASLLEAAAASEANALVRAGLESALFMEGLHPVLPQAPSDLLRALSAAGPCAADAIRLLYQAAFLGLAHDSLADLEAAGAQSPHEEVRRQARLGSLRLRVMRGDCAPDDLAQIESDAAGAQLGMAVVQAASGRALALLHTGQLEEARKHARRAVRMARTEAIPEAEFGANWVLARVRRHEGHAHLAIRILRSLFEHASIAWMPLIAWELALCGQGREIVEKIHCGPTEHLVALINAAREGDAHAAQRFRAELHAAFAHAPLLQREASVACDLLDPFCTPADAQVARWCRGEVNEPPLAFACSGALAGSQGQDLIAAVVAFPNGPARRVLAAGAIHPEAFVQSDRPGRTETAGAVLLLAGEAGISRTDFFERVYGFVFDPAAHKGPYEVLVHRLRKLLEPGASLDRSEAGTLVARVSKPMALPDPRCTRAVDDRLLRILAKQGGDSAKATAAAAGVSVRTVQEVLRRLVSDGSCQLVRHGRQLEYRVEDTTYSDPTSRGIRRQW